MGTYIRVLNIDENGVLQSKMPAEPLRINCEVNGCSSTNTNDYIRAGNDLISGWEDEPIALCDIHAKQKGYLIQQP